MSYTTGTELFDSVFSEDSEFERLLSLDADISAMLDFEIALAKAQAEFGLIPEAHRDAIASTTAQFRPDVEELKAGFGKDGVLPPTLVQQLKTQLPDDVQPSFHLGTTSQDLIDSSLVMRLRQVVRVSEERLLSLDNALVKLASEAPSSPLQARTRMQNALPISPAEKVGNWRSVLAGLKSDTPDYFPLQLGGPEGAARSFGDNYANVAQHMAKQLGLSAITHPWHADRRPVLNIAFWLSQVGTAMGKIARDVLMMAQSDVGEIAISGAGSSSAMPHKQNPVQAEIIVTLAKFCQTQMNGLNASSIHENERSGTEWTVEWLLLPKLAIASGAAAKSTRDLIGKLEFTAKDQGTQA